ncbi:MAG: hypothetical protein ACPG5P_01125 [Saprospiraceae bacterium]
MQQIRGIRTNRITLHEDKGSREVTEIILIFSVIEYELTNSGQIVGVNKTSTTRFHCTDSALDTLIENLEAIRDENTDDNGNIH